MFFRKPQKIFGLEICDTSISMCEIQGTRASITLLRGGTRNLPEGVVRDGMIMDGEAVVREITLLHEEAGISSKDVFLALPETDTFTHIVQISEDEKKAKELASHVIQEAQGFVPYPADELLSDYEILNSHAIISFAPKKIVTQYSEVLGKAGLSAHGIEPLSLSLGRALVQDEKAVLIGDLGSRISTLTLFDQGKIYFSDIVRSVAGGADVAHYAEPICTEVQKIEGFFKEKIGKQIERILLTGRSSKLKGVKEYIAEKIHTSLEFASVQAELSDPSADQRLNKGYISPAAFGLALRSNEQGINLLPKNK